MSEEQLKAADTDAALEQDFSELSDEELAGVTGGASTTVKNATTTVTNARRLASQTESGLVEAELGFAEAVKGLRWPEDFL